MRYRPVVIGITGSFGKTSTKEAVAAVLGKYYTVWSSKSNLNTEIGVPLTIIGGIDARRNVFLWTYNFLKTLGYIIIKSKKYPKVLVLEMAADRPGDIRYLRNLAKPKIGIITGIGEIPVHVMYFNSMEDVAKEKSQLIKRLPKNGYAVLNEDNDYTHDLESKTKAKVLTFGFSDQSSVKISDYKLNQVDELNESGISFRLEYQGSFVPVRVNNCIGKTNAYTLVAAASAGIAMSLNLVEISEAMSLYKPPKSRLSIIKGIKNSWIIDDTYNASPDSTLAALEALKEFDGFRKIAILGDMLELGEYTEDAHRKIGKTIQEYADIFFAVGPKMKFAFEEAEDVLMSKDRLCWFNNSEEARITIQNYIKPNDLILVKGSRGMKMEKIVEEIKG